MKFRTVRGYLFAAIFVALASAAYAVCQGVTVPVCQPHIAFDPNNPAASGYALVFSDNFTSSATIDFNATGSPGHNWYTAKFFGYGNEPAANIVTGVNGLTINPTFQTGNYNLATATPSTNTQGWIGNVWGGGAYFEAQFSFNGTAVINSGFAGWPSFWSLAIEHLAAKLADQVPGQAAGYESFVEDDFFEFDNTGSEPARYGAGIHNWYGNYAATCAYGYLAGQPHYCDILNQAGKGTPYDTVFVGKAGFPSIDWTTPHTVGHLWVPGTAANGFQGYVQNFIDGAPANTSEASQFPPLAKTAWTDGTIDVTTLYNSAQAYSILDQEHLAIILGSGTGLPFHVIYVHVWQIPGCGT